MNKVDLIASISNKTEFAKKDVEKVLTTFVDTVTDELKNGGKVQIAGFGSFEVAERAARECRNPRTGESVHVEATKAPKFKASKVLKETVNM